MDQGPPVGARALPFRLDEYDAAFADFLADTKRVGSRSQSSAGLGKLFFKSMDALTEATSNVVDAGGAPLTFDLAPASLMAPITLNPGG